MGIKLRINYWQRICSAYLGHRNSQLTFFHERPEINPEASIEKIGQYYMSFLDKANYLGPFDKNSVPLIDYQGNVGKQYCPVAVAQYGLAHYNLYKKNGEERNLEIATRQADWLVNNLANNGKGILVWMFRFDWEYRDKLKTPWYSALAQGNGISLLARIYLETKNKKYLNASQKAFKSFRKTVEEGGVVYIDKDGNYWLEEFIVSPPTHVLNGFIWTLWGIYDYWLLTKDFATKELFGRCIKTLKENLKDYDVGFWSLYEHSGTKMQMLASPFYHKLHIVQLEILYKITGESIFQEYADKWQKYQNNWFYRNFALIYKLIFKIIYY